MSNPKLVQTRKVLPSEQLCVFVKFPVSSGVEELQAAFNGIAKITKIVIPNDEKKPGQHRGMAFMTLKDEASVTKACNACISIGNQRLEVQISKKQSQKNNPQAVKKSKSKIDPLRVVQLRRIPHKSSHKAVISAMEEFGDLTDSYLPLRRNGKDNIGWARVVYSEARCASRALEAGSVMIDEQEVQIWRRPVKEVTEEAANEKENEEEDGGYYPSDEEGQAGKENASISQEQNTPAPTNKKGRTGMPPNEVFVGNLKFEWAESDVREYFLSFGAIDALRFPFDKKFGINKGYAVVTFNAEESAAKVLRQQDHSIKKWKVEVVGRTDFAAQDEADALEKIRSKVAKRRERRKRKHEEETLNREEKKRRIVAATGEDEGAKEEEGGEVDEEALASELLEWEQEGKKKEKKKSAVKKGAKKTRTTDKKRVVKGLK